MGVRKVEELDAFRLATQFKRSTYALVRANGLADADVRYRSQLFEAVASGESNIDEGFNRYVAGDMIRFLSYSRASNAEAQRRIKDGVDRGYFSPDQAEPALVLGRRAGAAAPASREV